MQKSSLRTKQNLQSQLCAFVVLALIVMTTIVLTTIDVQASRVKDIATIEGVAGTQVIGYGLVTGLANTGDTQQSRFTLQSVANLLKRFGVTVPPQVNFTNFRVRNAAAVMVTATIPPFLRKGARIDVQVSSIGDAQSLQGGILLLSHLSAQDGTVLATAQGGLSVGGFDFRSDGSRVGRNFVSSGRVPSGGIVEQEVKSNFINNQVLRVVLMDPDFTTASRVADAINNSPNLQNTAIALDGATVEVRLPQTQNAGQVTQFISQIESLQIQKDPAARVVINERTGTIVVGGFVQLLPGVVAHGGLDIQIQRVTSQAQQAPFTIAPPQPIQNSTLTVNQEQNAAIVVPATATVQDMASALNALKVSSRDLISIFQAMKEAGILQGDLIIQ